MPYKDPNVKKQRAAEYRSTRRKELALKTREWYRANRERALETSKQYRLKHPEMGRAAHRRWEAKNHTRILEYKRKWRKEHPNESRKSSTEYYHRHPEERRAYGAAWKRNNPDKRRAAHRKHMYGLSHDDFVVLLQSQNGRCAICTGVLENPFVDHDHTTGAVRGLLCPPCNKAIGFFRDRVDLLTQAIAYLNRSRMCTTKEEADVA